MVILTTCGFIMYPLTRGLGSEEAQQQTCNQLQKMQEVEQMRLLSWIVKVNCGYLEAAEVRTINHSSEN